MEYDETYELMTDIISDIIKRYIIQREEINKEKPKDISEVI